MKIVVFLLLASFGLVWTFVPSLTHRNFRGRDVLGTSLSPPDTDSTDSPVTFTDNNDGREDDKISALDDALYKNPASASMILDEISKIRSDSADATTCPQLRVEAYLESLLSSIDEQPLPWWSRIRPLRRFSRRARRLSLRRVLDLSTPSVAMDEEDSPEALRKRRQRSLLILLRALAATENEESSSGKGISIVRLEKVARKEAKATVAAEDMLQRTPNGLETPDYEVLFQGKGGFEIRRYEPFSVCSVGMGKKREANEKTDAKISSPQLAGASAFGALAGYLFGKNEEERAMKMTTPVLSRGEGDDRQMSFVLPSTYWDEAAKAPKPLEESGVTLEQYQSEDRASVMFGGFAGTKDVECKTEALLSNLKSNKEWMADPSESVVLAQYNDPFTPPWKRRNEVSVRVVSRNG